VPCKANGIVTGHLDHRCHTSRYTFSQGLTSQPFYCPTTSPACASVCALVAPAYPPPAMPTGVASAGAEAHESLRCPTPPRASGGRIWAPGRCWTSWKRRLALPGRWIRGWGSRAGSECRFWNDLAFAAVLQPPGFKVKSSPSSGANSRYVLCMHASVRDPRQL